MNRNVYKPPKKTYAGRIHRPEVPIPKDPEPEVLRLSKETQCFVTPPEVAERMVRYLQAAPDMTVLEPSVGTGNLVTALRRSGHSVFDIVAVEKSAELCNLLKRWPLALVNDDFLHWASYMKKAGVKYPRIIMNPPFGRGAAKRHIHAALDLLGPGKHDDAVLVAIVPVTYNSAYSETLETLPRDTFYGTAVSTKIIRLKAEGESK